MYVATDHIKLNLQFKNGFYHLKNRMTDGSLQR
nr:MAG TPA: Leader protein [Caudoviricetes sp.]